MYRITQYTKNKAEDLGVKVKPSKKEGKKIDVIKDGEVVASVGALGMGDYPTYLREKGKDYAEARRRLYKARHGGTRKIRGSPSWYADNLLW